MTSEPRGNAEPDPADVDKSVDKLDRLSTH
jgi:hypothetical protein